MIKIRIPWLSLGLVYLLTAAACKHRLDPLQDPGNPVDPGSGTPCDSNQVYFQQQVLPILISNCALSGCHDDASHEDGVILTSYQKVMTTAGIQPGNPGGSKLYESITDNDPGDRMPPPPRNPLTQEQVQIIRRWIQLGAQNLVCQNMCDSNNFTYSGAIRSLISNKCLGCHSGSAPQGGIDLSTHTAVKNRVTDGSLWGSINHLAGFSAMPKNGQKLSDCEINQVKKWIDSGSPNN